MANPTANSGTVTYFAITRSGQGTVTDISNYIRTVTPSYNAAELPTTTMGNSSESFISGFKNSEYTIEGVWDTTIDGYMMAIFGGTAAPFVYGPAGTATPNAKHSGSAVCLAYAPPSDINSAVSWSARFRVNGDVTRGTF